MRIHFCAFFVLLLVLTLVSCGGTEAESDEGNEINCFNIPAEGPASSSLLPQCSPTDEGKAVS